MKRTLIGLFVMLGGLMPNISQANSKVERPEVIFFDVNETLLNLESMNKPVSQVLGGDESLLPLWFSTMLHHSLVTTVSGDYQDFGKIGVAALQMVAKNKGLTITDSQAKQAIVPALLSLPPHKDVIPALKRLKQAGFKLVSLTNSSNAGVKAQFENAGLITYFDQRLSIEDIKVYKPDLRAYEWALQQLNIRPDQALMVAAHGWDVAGAKAAGMHTAFIARPQKQLYPLAEAPDYVLPDLTSLADELTTSGNE